MKVGIDWHPDHWLTQVSMIFSTSHRWCAISSKRWDFYATESDSLKYKIQYLSMCVQPSWIRVHPSTENESSLGSEWGLGVVNTRRLLSSNFKINKIISNCQRFLWPNCLMIQVRMSLLDNRLLPTKTIMSKIWRLNPPALLLGPIVGGSLLRQTSGVPPIFELFC